MSEQTPEQDREQDEARAAAGANVDPRPDDAPSSPVEDAQDDTDAPETDERPERDN
jgi:hypothetical protein